MNISREFEKARKTLGSEQARRGFTLQMQEVSRAADDLVKSMARAWKANKRLFDKAASATSKLPRGGDRRNL